MKESSWFGGMKVTVALIAIIIVGGIALWSFSPTVKNDTESSSEISEYYSEQVALAASSSLPLVSKEPIIMARGQQGVDLRNAPLLVKELDESISQIKVDTATLTIFSPWDFGMTVYLRDKDNVYLFSRGVAGNEEHHVIARSSGVVTTSSSEYVLYHLPLSADTVRIISEYYLADAETVLYTHWTPNNHGHNAFDPVLGIDAKTARDGSPKEDGVEYTNSTAMRNYVVVDAKNVFVGDKMVVANDNFHFLNWRTENRVYESIYARSGDQIVCVTGKKEMISGWTVPATVPVGTVLTADAKTFTPALISGETQYGVDEAGNAFIDCAELTKISDRPIQNLKFKSIINNDGRVLRLLLVSSDAVYGRTGQILAQADTTVAHIPEFKYLDDIGKYFIYDGRIYWYDEEYQEMWSFLVNNGDVDINSFKVLYSREPGSAELSTRAGVAKDARRVYVNIGRSTWGDEPKNLAFTPKDLTTFSVIDCVSKIVYFKDKYQVYDEDGSVIVGADPETFTRDTRCKSGTAPDYF